MTDQGELFGAGETAARSTARECPACGGDLDSPAERREGRCRRCIASGARALTLVASDGELVAPAGVLPESIYHRCSDCDAPTNAHGNYCETCLARRMDERDADDYYRAMAAGDDVAPDSVTRCRGCDAVMPAGHGQTLADGTGRVCDDCLYGPTVTERSEMFGTLVTYIPGGPTISVVDDPAMVESTDPRAEHRARCDGVIMAPVFGIGRRSCNVCDWSPDA